MIEESLNMLESISEFFMGTAHAQAAGTGAAGFDYTSFLPLVAVAVAFYFLIIRPQSNRARQEKEMLSTLTKGDRVVTAGGILGRILAIENDAEVVIEVEGGTQLRVLKTAIVQKLTPGSTASNVTPIKAKDESGSKPKPRRPTKAKKS